MYCNNCGKFLLENDKFCSNCGARVFQNEQNPIKDGPPEDFKSEASEDRTPKATPPIENIKWNIDDFPGHDVKKTEEINFDWGNTGVFKKPEATAEEIALNPVQKTDVPKPTEGGFIAAEIVEELVIQGKDLEEEIFAEASLVESIPAGGDIHKRTKIVDKFYTFSKKNEEFQKLLDKEYEKIKAGESDSLDEQTFRDRVSEINQKSDTHWPEFNPKEHIAEMALARERFFGPMEDPYKEPENVEPPAPLETPEAAEPPVAAETSEPPVAAEAPEAAEPPVAAEAPEAADEPEAIETPISEKSELPGEEPLPEDDILPDLEICKDEQTMPVHEEATQIEPTPPPTFTTPLDNHEIPEDFEEPKSSKEEVEESKSENLEEPKAEEPKSEDDVLSIRDKWIKYEEEEDEDEEKQSGGKVGKFVIGFLILLLLIQLALVGVRLVAPESAVAQFVDEKVQQVILFFRGENNASVVLGTEQNRSVAAEDKTGLIQLHIDKNYNDNIGDIIYNEELRLNTAKKYEDTALNQSTILQDNKWYTKDDGNIVYYDDQAVGAIISHESSRRLAEGESFATLEIGEIRISGENLFIWVAEVITPGDREEKIFRITVSGETMNVSTEYDV